MGAEQFTISVLMETPESTEGSLGELYVRYAPEGIRLAYLLTGDRALAEDLVQEAFARFVGRFKHLRQPEAFGPYLRRTIINLSRSHFRHAKVERAYVEKERRAPSHGADGTGLRQITHSGYNWGPAWSPDGSQIAFRSDVRNLFLFTVAPDGSRLRMVDTIRPSGPITWNPVP